MTAPKYGDRVRVTVEGVVDRTTRGQLTVRHNSGWTNVFAAALVSVEVLPSPEPEWKPGDVVRDAGRITFERTEHGWSVPGSADRYSHDFPVRPLTRLVPEGQS